MAGALANGVTPARLRGGDLAVPFHGVRSRSNPGTTLERARAYAPRLRATDVFSHITAAELVGLRGPEGWSDPRLHVTVVAPDRAARATGVVGHQSDHALSTVVVDGLPVTAPVRTWLDCAALLRRPLDVLVMADGLLDRRAPLATPDELRRAVWQNVGRRGQRTLRWALDLARPGTDSARETMLRITLLQGGLPEPTINAPILGRDGELLGHGDLVYPDQRVIIEYEGSGHREAQQFHFDIRRLDRFVEAGWRVIRVDKYLLATPALLVAAVRRALAASAS